MTLSSSTTGICRKRGQRVMVSMISSIVSVCSQVATSLGHARIDRLRRVRVHPSSATGADDIAFGG